LIIGAVFANEFIYLTSMGRKSPYAGEKQVKKWFIPFFIIKLFLTALAIEVGIWQTL
jgi:hypothetical protein